MSWMIRAHAWSFRRRRHLVKPFAFVELLARTARCCAAPGPRSRAPGDRDLEIDGSSGGEPAAPIDLTPASSRCCTCWPPARRGAEPTQIASYVWDMNFDKDTTS